MKNNNIFSSMITDEVFKIDVIERIFDDYKAWRNKDNPFTREEAERAIYDYIDELSIYVDIYLNEEFDDENTEYEVEPER